MHCLPQRPKSTFFEKFSRGGAANAELRVKKNFQKMLILVFEVIVQPPKNQCFWEKNLRGVSPKDTRSEEKMSKNLDFSL